MARLTLSVEDREVLREEFVVISPDSLGDMISSADGGLEELREAVEHVRRLLVLHELREHGEIEVDEQDAAPLAKWLWAQAIEANECARYELGRLPKIAVDHRFYGIGDSREECEAQAREQACGYDREAEVCARLIEQLGRGRGA